MESQHKQVKQQHGLRMDKHESGDTAKKGRETARQIDENQLQALAKRRRSRRKAERVDGSTPKIPGIKSDKPGDNKNVQQSRILRVNKTGGRNNPNRRYGMVMDDIVIDMEEVIHDIQKGKITLESLPQLGLFPLHEAVARGLVKSAQKLIELGVQLTSETPEGLTPLEVAVMAGHFDAAALLIQHGAPVDRIRDGIPR